MANNPWNVSESALRIIQQRPRYWPGELFCQVLMDEVDASRHLLSSPPVGTRPRVELAGTNRWILERNGSLMRVYMDVLTWLRSDFEPLFSRKTEECVATDTLKGVWGKFFIPADAPAESTPAIIAISRRLAALYRQAIELQHSMRNADVHPVFREATYEASFHADPLLRLIECLGPAIFATLKAHRDPASAASATQAAEALAATELAMKECGHRFDSSLKAFKIANERLRTGSARADTAPGTAGYLYILTNPSLGSTVKVGKTKRSPRDRIDELSSSTAIPTPFVLAFDAYVEDCDRAEAYVHARLERDGYRVAKNREFFNVDLTTAIAVILEAQKEERKRNEKQREARR